jgi:hypothetical protein
MMIIWVAAGITAIIAWNLLAKTACQWWEKQNTWP